MIETDAKTCLIYAESWRNMQCALQEFYTLHMFREYALACSLANQKRNTKWIASRASIVPKQLNDVYMCLVITQVQLICNDNNPSLARFLC